MQVRYLPFNFLLNVDLIFWFTEAVLKHELILISPSLHCMDWQHIIRQD